MAKENGLNPNPKIVAELGPGDSIGIGLAALISGSKKYLALDVVEYADTKRNLDIFKELVALFKNRTAIPGQDEFKKVKPILNRYDFPVDILDEARLERALEKERIESLWQAVKHPENNNNILQYHVPWHGKNIIERESVDLLFSQAVLEHVDDLKKTYKSMFSLLKPTGYISHQIDFKCHGTANEWNGHWQYTDFMWKLIKGKRSYFLNREPHSTHIAMLEKEGFKIVIDQKIKSKSNLTIDDLPNRFNSMSEEDLTTSGAFIQAVKPDANDAQPRPKY
jgi:SAM-dependent methyltransferase